MPPFRDFIRSLPLLIAASALACQGDGLIEPSFGTLEITTSTAGAEPDADGYTVQVDAKPVQTIGPTGAVRTSDVIGDHTVRLDGVAANCAVAGENPRRVALSAADTTTVSFSVMCSASMGSIEVTSSTSGAFPDRDGYLITIDGVARRTVSAQGRESFNGLAPGNHAIGLSGVAANCRVQGPNPHPAEIKAGEPTAFVFEIDCTVTPPIAFTSFRGAGSAVYVVNPDGTGLTKLTPDGDAPYQHPVWAPDGRKIAIFSYGDLHIMNADGTGLTRLYQGTGAAYGAANARWSPDGKTIAFDVQVIVDCQEPEYCYQTQVWTVHSDGTGLRRLADGTQATWSPDGSKIAFSEDQIYVINADGSGLTEITSLSGEAFAPEWSPDGTRLAFATFVSSDWSEIFVVNTDGTGLVGLTAGRGYDTRPVWSPDGTRIAFKTLKVRENLEYGIAVVNADGRGRAILTNQGSAEDPIWSPDGIKIAFTRIDDRASSDFEVYLMNADGSGLINLSNGHPSLDGEPSWSSR